MGEEVNDYQEQLEALIQQAQRGEITQEEFEDRVAEVTAAILLLAFLLGSRQSLAVVMNNFEIQQIIASNERIAQESVRRLAEQIYLDNLFVNDTGIVDQEQIRSRVELWAGTALGIHAIGQMFRRDDPFLQWVVGPTEHCTDCARLNGQVHRASEWRASGWAPRIRRLQCNGYRCACSFIEAEGPARGDF